MTPRSGSGALWHRSTAVWEQQLCTAETGFELRRRFCRRVDALPARTEVAADRLPDSSDSPVRWASPTLRDETAVFTVRGSAQIAEQLWPEPGRFWTDRTGVEAFTELGRALRQLHTEPPDFRLPTSTPHLERLAAYLDDRCDTSGAATAVLTDLGADVVAVLRIWLRELPPADALGHGGLSLGSTFVDADPTVHIDVVVGPELVRTTPAVDLGWIVGELMEFSYLRAIRGIPGDPYRRLATAFTTGYRGSMEGPMDDEIVHRVALLRIVLHLCDYAETVRLNGDAGAHAHLAIYTPFVRGLVAHPDHREEGE
ncbi:hypothetical protein ACIGGF_21260 [Rhodococcus sp. NPDC078407]|uniref:hypothetical protein n=1 Tax=Rhodococcus sp. NPDC078407 TaxID=3364509 RepID=UPI0037CC9BD1